MTSTGAQIASDYPLTSREKVKLASEIDAAIAPLVEAESDGWERGMRDAAVMCGSLAETTYDDADAFQAASGCEAEIVVQLRMHQRNRAAIAKAKQEERT